MIKKKKPEPVRLDTITGYDAELEAKIDAMMDPSLPDPTEPRSVSIIEPTDNLSDNAPEIDIFQGVDTPDLAPLSAAPDVADESIDEHPEPDDTQADTSTETKKAPRVVPIGSVRDNQVLPAASSATKASEKNAVAAAQQQLPKKKQDRLLKRWWRNKKVRVSVYAFVFVVIVAVLAWPTTRYAVLNTVGVRSSASMQVVDGTTGLPLRNVTVSLAGKEMVTDANGTVQFNQIKLGATMLTVRRVAFAPVSIDKVIGWGSNPFGEIALQATGAQYTFTVTDYLSGKPLEGAEVTSGTASAFADADGEAILTIDDPKEATITVSLTAKEYRTDTLSIPVARTAATPIAMVSARPIVYITKQSGTYDVYRIDADGQNQRLLLPGSGTERDAISLLSSPDGSHAVLVSSREERRDADGFLVDTVTLIETTTGASRPIDYAQNIQLLDWRGDTLVYRAAYAAESAATNQRQRIIAYNVTDSSRNVLVSGNYFNGIVAIGGSVYYLVNAPDKGEGIFGAIRLDGSGQKTLQKDRGWLLVRTAPNELRIQNEAGWSRYDTTSKKLEASTEPINYGGQSYTADPSGTYTAWIDTRDGRNVLLIRTLETNKDEPLYAERGVSGPVQWLGAHTTSFYVDTGDETAVYVVSTEGGDARKLANATIVRGISGAY